MVTNAHGRTRRDGVQAALNDSREAERYHLRQREIRRRMDTTRDRPRPLEFDELGFPLPQPIPTFARRVARLLRDA
jgi:hypothetical protein